MFNILCRNFCVIALIAIFTGNTQALQHIIKCRPRKTAANNIGADYTCLSDALKPLGFTFVKKNGNTSFYKDAKNKNIEFISGSKQIIIDNTKVFLAQPIKADSKSNHFIAKIDIGKTLKPLISHTNETGQHLTFSTKNKIAKVTTVVIDAGHGGKAKGAENKELKLVEKTLALSTALALKSVLQAKGINAILTRSTDENISLDDRAAFANKNNADIFVSIHYNHAPSSSACGIETYSYSLLNTPSTDRTKLLPADKIFARNNSYDECNTLLGFYVQSNASKITNRQDRGLRRSRFSVLKDVNCPAILIECGFLSNKEEAKIISTTQFQQKLTNAIASGITSYINSN